MNYEVKVGVCTGNFYGYSRKMVAHAVVGKSDTALCGYKPEYGWDSNPVPINKHDSVTCKRCLKKIAAFTNKEGHE